MPPPLRPFRPWTTAFSAAVILGLIALTMREAPVPHNHFRGVTFGLVEYRVLTADSNLRTRARNKLSHAIQDELDAINATMSTYVPDSEISRFNASDSDDWVELPADFAAVVAAAIGFAAATDGAFDPTVAGAVNRAGYGEDKTATNAVVGIEHIELDGDRLRKSRPDVRINLSAIAKGYAVDRVSALLNERGITNHLVEIGGEVRASGVSTNGAPWPVFITVPRPGPMEVHTRVDRADIAVATSGIAYQSRKENGRVLHHLIDPGTGEPTTNDLLSVSVMATSCMEADALATAYFVMGRERGLAHAQARDGVEALFLWVDDEQTLSESRTAGWPE